MAELNPVQNPLVNTDVGNDHQPTLRTAWILNSPFTAAEQRFGISTDRHTERLAIFNHVKAAEARLRSLVLDFKPTDQAGVSVRHHRDIFLALAIEIALQPFVSKTLDFTQPTAHAFRWVSRHEIAALYPSLDHVPTYGGRPGCLAYYLNHSTLPVGASILHVLEKCLCNFWQLLNIDYRFTTPAGRQHHLLRQLCLDHADFARWVRQWQIERTTNTALQKLERGTCIPKELFQQLAVRLLLGEYDRFVLQILAQIEHKPSSLDLEQLAETLSNYWPPAGPVLAYSAFIVEGLAKAATLLSCLPSDVLNNPIDVFCREQPAVAEQIAWSLSLAYDAADVLKRFATWNNAAALQSQIRANIESFLPAHASIAAVGFNRLTHRFWHVEPKLHVPAAKRNRYIPKPYEVVLWQVSTSDLPQFTLTPTQPYHIPVAVVAPSSCLQNPETFAAIRAFAQTGYATVAIAGIDLTNLCQCSACQQRYERYCDSQRYDKHDVDSSHYRFFQTLLLQQAIRSLPVKVIGIFEEWLPEAGFIGYEAVLLQQTPSIETIFAAQHAGVQLLCRINEPTVGQLLFYHGLDVAVVTNSASSSFVYSLMANAEHLRGYRLGGICWGTTNQMYSGDQQIINVTPSYPFVYKASNRSLLIQFLEPLDSTTVVYLRREIVSSQVSAVQLCTVGNPQPLSVLNNQEWYYISIEPTDFPFVRLEANFDFL